MPCCVLCPNYKFVNGKPKVNKRCPYHISDDAPPRWTLLKVEAPCFNRCEYFMERDEDKLWWCMRPFSYEVNPITAAEAVKFSSRAIIKSPHEQEKKSK